MIQTRMRALHLRPQRSTVGSMMASQTHSRAYSSITTARPSNTPAQVLQLLPHQYPHCLPRRSCPLHIRATCSSLRRDYPSRSVRERRQWRRLASAFPSSFLTYYRHVSQRSSQPSPRLWLHRIFRSIPAVSQASGSLIVASSASFHPLATRRAPSCEILHSARTSLATWSGARLAAPCACYEHTVMLCSSMSSSAIIVINLA
jgi:hypothetical protein